MPTYMYIKRHPVGGFEAETHMHNAGVPALVKFQKCPEIVLEFEIVLKFYSFGKNVLKMAFDAQ